MGTAFGDTLDTRGKKKWDAHELHVCCVPRPMAWVSLRTPPQKRKVGDHTLGHFRAVTLPAVGLGPCIAVGPCISESDPPGTRHGLRRAVAAPPPRP